MSEREALIRALEIMRADRDRWKQAADRWKEAAEAYHTALPIQIQLMCIPKTYTEPYWSAHADEAKAKFMDAERNHKAEFGVTDR